MKNTVNYRPYASRREIVMEVGVSDNKLTPYARETRRVGRNDYCPCGSGKKFKRCCLNKEPIV